MFVKVSPPPFFVLFIFLVSGHFSPRRSYFKMDLQREFFDFFQIMFLWKAETKMELNLLKFFVSEVI